MDKYILQKIMDLSIIDNQLSDDECLPHTKSEIDYERVCVMLLSGLQQLKLDTDSKISELERKIEKLEKRFDYL